MSKIWYIGSNYNLVQHCWDNKAASSDRGGTRRQMTEGPGPEGRAEGLVSASASEQPDDARGPNPVPLSATENAQTARGHLDLPSTVTLLKAPGPPFRDSPQECEVYILGTAHISKASCEDVRKVISAVRPEVVFLELCQERRSLLTCTAADFKPLPLNKLVAEVRKGLPLFTAVYSWMLCRVGESLDAPPGEEFRVALEEARKVNAKVVLGDRRVSITIARTWAAMNWWDRMRFLGNLILNGISPPDHLELESMKSHFRINAEKLLLLFGSVGTTTDELEPAKWQDADVVTRMIMELGREFPRLLQPLLNERDQFMVYMLNQIALQGSSSIVAVVGAGHVPGMKNVWHDDIYLADLLKMPEKRQGFKWGRLLLLSGAVGISAFVVVRLRRR